MGPRNNGGGYEIESYSHSLLNELIIMQTCHYKEVAQEGIISRDPRFRDLSSKEDSFMDLVRG